MGNRLGLVMRNRLRLFGLAGVLALVLGSVAFAAGTQTATISSTTFTDLGVAPVQVQTLTQPVIVVVADTIPTVGTPGTNLLPGQLVQFNPADASSHVWAPNLGATVQKDIQMLKQFAQQRAVDAALAAALVPNITVTPNQ